MECRDVRQFAEAFVSEQLLIETTRTVVGHLEHCPACRVEIDGLRRLRTATKSAFAGAAELQGRPEFVAALTARLQTEAAGRQRRPALRRLWLPVAASLLLLLGAGWGWRVWSASGLTALLQAAVGDHRFCALTFKLAERPIKLEDAASRYGGVYRQLETVEPSSAALSGGPLRIVERHSCVFNGRRFAHIVLVYKGQPVSLLVADDERRGPAWLAPGSRADASPSDLPVTDGFNVASFRGARHMVFVISSLDGSDVMEVAQAMSGPVSQALTGA